MDPTPTPSEPVLRSLRRQNGEILVLFCHRPTAVSWANYSQHPLIWGTETIHPNPIQPTAKP